MRKFEYKAIPAPRQGTKVRGVKSTDDRFALSLTDALNEMAADGWEYLRAETLPCDERKGLTGTQTNYQNILVFRRLEASVDLLTLDATPRIVSVPSERSVDVSDQVALRPVSSQPIEANTAPPLGAARED